MTRTGDRTPPTLAAPPHTPWSDVAKKLHVALERLPDAAYVWDDVDEAVVWEDAPPAPAAHLLEPFNDFTTNGWSLLSGPTIVAGRTGTAAQTASSAAAATWTIPAGLYSDTITLGFAFRLTDAQVKQRELLQLRHLTGGLQNRLRVEATGELTFTRAATALAASATGLIAANVWYYIELQARLHDTAGTCTVRLNGTPVITATGLDTKPSGDAEYQSIQIGSQASSTTHQYDDLYVTTGPSGTFLGDITIPPAAGLLAYPTPYVYDAPFIGGGFTDAVCDFIAVTVESGRPDEHGLMESAEATVTLANTSGDYSTMAADGRLVYWAPGREVLLWADVDGAPWWLFAGRVTTWTENTDSTVTVVANDGFTQLTADPARDWTPGTASQTAAQRIGAILTTAAYVGVRDLETGFTPLANPPTDRSPLEEIQVTALSDGGVVFCDADGAFTYRGRSFTAGRTDQTVVRAFSDNRCDLLVVWDLQVVVDDVGLASAVRLENWEATPKVATATNPSPPWDRPYLYTHPDEDLWTAQADGDLLAADLLKRYTADSARYTWQLYLHDPNQPALWRAGIDLRLGDLVNVVRDFTAAGGELGVTDVDCLVGTIVHEITPESWVVSVETGRTVAYRSPLFWDRAPYTWDDETSLNVWSA